MTSSADYFPGEDDTIVSQSTPAGSSHSAIVRLSGPQALPIAGRLFKESGADRSAPEEPSRVWTRRLSSGASGNYVSLSGTVSVFRDLELPAKLYIMKAPFSYTRQDVAELHVAGSGPIVSLIIQKALSKGARLALPGEFTFRAFANGRLDLPQAEAVLKVIHAKSQAERLLAARELDGAFSQKAAAFRNAVFDLVVRMEASIDFSDQEIEIIRRDEIERTLARLCAGLDELTRRGRDEYYYNEGITVVVLGRTNVGKSTLVNALLEKPLALVDSSPRTTRDPLDESIIIEDVLFNLWDTAGLAEPFTSIDDKALGKTRELKERARIILFVVDGSCPLTDEDRALYGSVRDRNHIVVLNKTDIGRALSSSEVKREFDGARTIRISALTGMGVHRLKSELAGTIKRGQLDTACSHFLLNVRQRKGLENALQNLKRAQSGLRRGLGQELIAFDVRSALDDLGALLGQVDADAILEDIFSNFCIGK